jgi:DNA-binding response OmpR family regulator
LFILEHQLREMSGVELCRRIRQTDKKTPILFFSGRTRLMVGEVSIAAGATEYLVRPIGEDHLIDTIRRLLRDRIYSGGESKNQSSCCLAK